jgi:hypothetical protein
MPSTESQFMRHCRRRSWAHAAHSSGCPSLLTQAAAAVVESLERRTLLSGSFHLSASQLKALKSLDATPQYLLFRHKSASIKSTLASAAAKKSASQADVPSGYGGTTPAQMLAAYGLNNINFGGVVGNGAGQTIAIVDAYDDPTALADLNTFSADWTAAGYSLPSFNTGSGPTFTKYNENGQTGAANLPGTDPGNLWEVEESLDIEWAHVIAPQANIALVEANSDNEGDMFGADGNAALIPGVSVVSNSWSGDEYSLEYQDDSTFDDPGVSFFFATGDTGAPAAYPASSPYAIAVGGTTLSLNAAGTGYGSEAGWTGSGGGVSAYEAQPNYQIGQVNGLGGSGSSAMRTTPDISMDADPNTGVSIIDTYNWPDGSWQQYGGTSLATPMVSAMFAIVNQGRSLAGESALDSTQVLTDLYELPSSNFHDITSGTSYGSPNYTAGVGYDLVTGIGTPIANNLVPTFTQTPPVVTTNPSSATVNVGTTVTFTAVATGATSEQWMVETPTATSFSPISGATSSTLSLGAATLAESGNQYEAVFSSSSAFSSRSNVATLTVDPVWLSPSSVATWNSSTHVLTVKGATTINADPGTDEPIVEASGSKAVVKLNPTSGTDIHLGGLMLSSQASAVETSLGSARSVTNYHVLVIGTPGSSVAPLYSIATNSTLNLADNDMIILYGSGTSPLAPIEAELTEAYNNGSWNKSGLSSSVAATTKGVTGLGYGEASTLGDTTFDGVSLGGNAVLVKYTLVGDTTLSGTVGGSDYSTVLAHFDTSGVWTQGSFYYNGTVDGSDYQAVLNNYDLTLANILPGG